MSNDYSMTSTPESGIADDDAIDWVKGNLPPAEPEAAAVNPPAAEEPAAEEQPAATGAALDQPAVDGSQEAEPLAPEPVAEVSATAEPATTAPAATEPPAEEPTGDAMPVDAAPVDELAAEEAAPAEAPVAEAPAAPDQPEGVDLTAPSAPAPEAGERPDAEAAPAEPVKPAEPAEPAKPENEDAALKAEASRPESVEALSPLPTTEPLNLESLVESLLFVAEGPVPVARLAEALEISPREVEAALTRLTEVYRQRGLNVQRLHDKVQLTTSPAAAERVQRFLGLAASTPLSRAALETLAIIAYQQPVTRPQIESVRGVNSDGVIKNLLSKGIIEEVGRTDGPGRPVLYATTSEFLQYFGIASLADLPPLNLEGKPAASESGAPEILKG